jgi:hypothetical protein
MGGRFSMGGFEVDPTGAKIPELEPGHRMSLAFGPIVSSWELRRFHEVPGWRSRWLGFGAPEMPDGMIMSEQAS